MIRARRTDANQVAIVAYLRGLGASVAITSALGQGFPDLAVGFRGVNYFVEVKDGTRKLSDRRLTPDEQTWHAEWRGRVAVVESVEDILKLLEESDDETAGI